MCNLACKSSEFVMVDPWEANQSTYQWTLTVLSRIKTSLCESGLVSSGTLKVMLIRGSDLVESFSTPGVWIRDQNNIKIVDGVVPNGKGHVFDKLRWDCISRGLSVKYLTADEVIDYIKQHDLYIMQKSDDASAVK